jgi:hypothetical protein
MSTRQTRRYCRNCQQHTLHAKETTMSFGWGLLLTILTAGLFLPFWLLITCAGFLRPYRCQTCGKAGHLSARGVLGAFLYLAIVIAGLITLFWLLATHL